MVPVQIEEVLGRATETSPLTNGVCGTCQKCGRQASAEINAEGRPNGPVARKKDAILDVLHELEQQCEHRTSWGMVEPHYDRGIPKGINLYIIDPASGYHFPLMMVEGKLAGIWGGVHPEKGKPIIVPDSDQYDTAAGEFKVILVKKGYRLTTLARADSVRLRPKTTTPTDPVTT